MMQFAGLLLVFLSLAAAFPQRTALEGVDLGIEFESDDPTSLPLLKLPYGTWRAARYDEEEDIYTFKNIRFAAPPLGERRFAAPELPEVDKSEIHDGSYGPVCRQSAPSGGFNVVGSANKHPFGVTLNRMLGTIPTALTSEGDEDCLFLDLYVPGPAVRGDKQGLAVVVYIYGGAYIMGSKDSGGPFYDGTSIVRSSKGNVIFVVGNYRVGAFGWLAGSTMEAEGTPNAGLLDQRALFQWVQAHISLLGGDANEITAWGLSAGAGSIYHHLIAKGGTQDPLFKRAILQSPAFATRWDRKGLLEDVFNRFAAFAGCAGQGLDCLRNASPDVLNRANKWLQNSAPRGSYLVGPSADGDYIRQLACLEFASDNYWKGIDSLIISHTSDEAEVFVLGDIDSDDKFSRFLNEIFPEYAQSSGIVAAIERQYPSPFAPNSIYSSQTERLKDLLRDSSFIHNTRALTDAYQGKTYNMQYSAGPGWHAMDLLPTFWVLNKFRGIFRKPIVPSFGSFALSYQSYLTSFARTGDPNEHRLIFAIPNTIKWPRPSKVDQQYMNNVLNVGEWGFSIIEDRESPRDRFEFWTAIAAALTNVGGYAVPGTELRQDLITVTDNPNRDA